MFSLTHHLGIVMKKTGSAPKKATEAPKKANEKARQLAVLTLQLEKYSQVKEQYFADKFDITPAEFRCLRFIYDAQLISTKRLSQQMKLTAGRITHLLNSLQNKDLLTRTIAPIDRRGIDVRLTSKAIKDMDIVIEEYARIQEDIFKVMPSIDRDDATDILYQYFSHLKDWIEKI